MTGGDLSWGGSRIPSFSLRSSDLFLSLTYLSTYLISQSTLQSIATFQQLYSEGVTLISAKMKQVGNQYLVRKPRFTIRSSTFEWCPQYQPIRIQNFVRDIPKPGVMITCENLPPFPALLREEEKSVWVSGGLVGNGVAHCSQ